MPVSFQADYGHSRAINKLFPRLERGGSALEEPCADVLLSLVEA